MMAHHLAVALAGLSDADPAQLRSLADDAHGQTAGLLAAISHAADWEHHRRSGIDFEMPPLGDAIDEGDLDAALGLAVAFHVSIADRFEAPEQVLEVIVAIVGVLRSRGTNRRLLAGQRPSSLYASGLIAESRIGRERTATQQPAPATTARTPPRRYARSPTG